MEKFLIARDEQRFYAFPDIAVTRSGKLICTFMDIIAHTDRDTARLGMIESTDHGRTWFNKHYLTPPGKKDRFYNCARISRLSDDSIVIICDYMCGEFKDECGDNEIHVWYGDPEGEQFDGPYILPFHGFMPDKLIELNSGRFYVGSQLRNRQTGALEVYGHYSDDRGKTWSDAVPMGVDPRYHLCEVSTVEAEKGVLVAMFRENQNLGLDGFKSISYDNGASWNGVYQTNLIGMHRPTLGKLIDGRFFVTFRLRQGGKARNQLTLASIFDITTLMAEKRSDNAGAIMPIDYDRSPRCDNGYTGWIQFDSGEIYVVNYIVDDWGRGQIKGYSILMDDIEV
ncbi:MAG: sialidase family protein [Eubacteriales bacterium]